MVMETHVEESFMKRLDAFCDTLTALRLEPDDPWEATPEALREMTNIGALSGCWRVRSRPRL